MRFCQLVSFWLLAVLVSAPAPPAGRLRVNRALRATHSRRQVDRIIAEGRLRVNGEVATSSDSKLLPGDLVTLDDEQVIWEEDELAPHRYIKYNKARGVVCTTDPRVPGNVIDALTLADFDHKVRRVYPIGRLDAESTGLILLTSDGSVVNPLLRASEAKRKEYEVITLPRASDADVARLSEGVVITTIAQRDGEAQPVTAPTAPCIVERLGEPSGDALRFVLQEGRNRQVGNTLTRQQSSTRECS